MRTHGLSRPCWRDTNALSDRRHSILRLTRAIIAALLAVSMAIFPISMPQAAMKASHHGAQAAHSHVHDHAAAQACLEGDSGVIGGDRSACHEHPDADGKGDTLCCGSIVCHVFQVSVAADLYTPIARSISLAVAVEEQVPSAFIGRIERPPRTV